MANGDGSNNSDEGGPLADQLADLEVDVDEQGGEDEEAQSDAGGESVPEDERRSDEDLFREAVENLDEDQIREAKFDDPDRGTAEPETPSEEEDSQEVSTAHGESAADARLADQLSDMDVESEDLPEGEEPAGEDEREEAPMPRDVSAREAFEKAIEDMSPAEMRRQKYDLPSGEGDASRTGGTGDSEEGASDGDRKQSEEAKREEIRRRREERKFQEAMRDVDEMDGEQKFRAPSAPDPTRYFDETESSRTAADFATPTLPKSGQGLKHVSPLNDVQEEMVEQAEAADDRGELRILNLRGETTDDAAEMLSDFAERCQREGIRYARIVPGRGEQSDGDPVLKPLVLRWLETKAVDAIRGYAPERTIHGDYGSLIIEFRRE